MTCTINASTTNNLQMSSDGSGIVKLQSNGVTTNALAWCRFGQSGVTPASQYNVSSITLISTGYYSVSFTTNTTDANYSILLTNSDNPTLARVCVVDSSTAPTTSGFRFYSFASTNSTVATVGTYFSFVIFGN